MRTKEFRRNQEKVKDLRRRKLYRNRAINGRYEISSKEDESVTYKSVYAKEGINLVSHWGKVMIHPDKLTDDVGHWQEYPKTHNYGSKGYNRFRITNKTLRQSLKAKIEKELEE